MREAEHLRDRKDASAWFVPYLLARGYVILLAAIGEQHRGWTMGEASERHGSSPQSDDLDWSEGPRLDWR